MGRIAVDDIESFMSDVEDADFIKDLSGKYTLNDFIRADIDLYFVHRHAREVGQLQYSLIALANRSFLVRAAIGNLGGRRDIPRRDDSVLTIHRQGQYR